MIQDELKYKTVNSLILKYKYEHFFDDGGDLDETDYLVRIVIRVGR